MYLSSVFDKYVEIKILRYLLQASSGISVSALAKSAKVNKASVSIFLRKLEKDGVVTKSEIGNVHLYVANDSPLLHQLKVTFSLTELTEAGLVENLLKANDTITSVVLYGSHASGTDDDRSDLDILLVVGNKKKISLTELEDELGKGISLESFTLSDWKKTKKENTPFYDSVIRNHIILWGGGLP